MPTYSDVSLYSFKSNSKETRFSPNLSGQPPEALIAYPKIILTTITDDAAKNTFLRCERVPFLRKGFSIYFHDMIANIVDRASMLAVSKVL